MGNKKMISMTLYEDLHYKFKRISFDTQVDMKTMLTDFIKKKIAEFEA